MANECNSPYGERGMRIKEAARQILAVPVRLGLTWGEFEKAIEKVKWSAYVTDSNSSSGSELK